LGGGRACSWFRLSGSYGARERDLTEEMASHLELQIEDNLCAGMTPQEAQRQPRLRFGGVEAIKEQLRERRGLPALETLGRDLRHGLRLMVRTPGFTVVVVLSLAVGIGGNSAIFSVLNTRTLRPLPVPRPQELSLVVSQGDPSRPDREQMSFPVYQRLLAALPAGARLGAMGRVMTAEGQLGAGGQALPIRVQPVSGEIFGALDLSPARGRFLGPEDNRHPGGHPVAVISHACWQQRFAGTADVVGRSLHVNGTRFTVVGVAPVGFAGVWLESPVEVFVPLAMQATVGYAQNYSSENGTAPGPSSCSGGSAGWTWSCGPTRGAGRRRWLPWRRSTPRRCWPKGRRWMIPAASSRSCSSGWPSSPSNAASPPRAGASCRRCWC
jgi:hypothetical protein